MAIFRRPEDHDISIVKVKGEWTHSLAWHFEVGFSSNDLSEDPIVVMLQLVLQIGLDPGNLTPQDILAEFACLVLVLVLR